MAIEVSIEGGTVFEVSAVEDSLLGGALRAGIGWPYECGVGGCGSCRFDLLSGDVETLWAEAPGLSERDRRRGKRLACQSRPRGVLSVRVRTSGDYVPPVAPVRRTVRLRTRRMLTPDMAELTFQSATPADFLPGQYTLFRAPAFPGARAYSMSNLANAGGVFQFIIRRTPGGTGSGFLCDGLTPGGEMLMDGPFGNAYWRQESVRPMVCVAGGSGVAPMLSIARAARLADAPRRVHFFDGARTEADLCAGSFLADLAGEGFSYTPVLSAPGTGRPGTDRSRTDLPWTGAIGFVHETVRRVLSPPAAQYDYYFAGPPAMIDAMQNLLVIEQGVPHSQIHFDRFA